MTISMNELERLRAPFPLAAHTVREGHRTKKGDKIRWFVYIQRNEVQDRLEDIFPGEWATEKPEVNAQGKNVSALVGITIRGVTRWDGGEDDSNEGTKGALTNAFRRTAAYGWHIGRYLYDMDFEIWTASYGDNEWDKQRELKKEAFKKFEAWFRGTFGTGTAQNGVPVSTTPAVSKNAGNPPSDADPIWFSATVGEAWTDIKKYLLAKKVYTNEHEMKNSMIKRGVIVDNLITDAWKAKLSRELIKLLETRHEEKAS